MNSKSLRRLAADHGSLHSAGLPPNYLFEPSITSDDLTSLDVLLAGPIGTPYAKGVWKLHLDIPPNYPTAPPTATFRTRLWHPNIDEDSGAVCVETLKRDWSSSVKLRDVLVTISCLLIQPNPASALNEAAGKLASEDWDGFCRRARLMTGIHAPIPADLLAVVREAQMRGEEKDTQEDKKEAVAGTECTSVAPAIASKLHESLAEDEENRKRRGDTIEPQSDSESDWIPAARPSTSHTAARDNIFGIKGLEHGMQVDGPPKKPISMSPKSVTQDETDHVDGSNPFITVPLKRNAQQSFSLYVPPVSSSSLAEEPLVDTPDLLKFSHKNPFSAIQPNNQNPPLIREFSWSWQESEIIHETGTIKDGPTKSELRKRMSGDEFEEKRKWELKKFKRTGYDLAKYNRGDFGPRKGIARL